MKLTRARLEGILPSSFGTLSHLSGTQLLRLECFLSLVSSTWICISFWKFGRVDRYFIIKYFWKNSIEFSIQILSGRQNQQRQSEFNLAITLISIVFMHIVCNALRVFLGVLVVALVGKRDFLICWYTLPLIYFRCSSFLYKTCWPIHPTALGNVPGVRCPSAGHVQFLFKFSNILFSVKSIQGSSVESFFVVVVRNLLVHPAWKLLNIKLFQQVWSHKYQTQPWNLWMLHQIKRFPMKME